MVKNMKGYDRLICIDLIKHDTYIYMTNKYGEKWPKDRDVYLFFVESMWRSRLLYLKKRLA